MQFKLIENGDSVRKHDRNILQQVIFNLKEDEDSYIVLEPKKPIGNSIYMQTIRLKGQYKIETRLIFGSDDDFKHYSYLSSDKDEVFSIFDLYYTDGKLPRLQNWTDETPSFKEEEERDIVKLYKETDGAIHYFEMWIDEDETLTSHEGILGEIGETESFGAPEKNEDSLPPRIAMSKAIQTYLNLGYTEDITWTEIIVQVAAKASDKELTETIEAMLNNCLGWTGNGHCDGSNTDNKLSTFFCYVVDKVIAVETIVEAFEEEDLDLDNLRIAYADDKTEEYMLIYPNEGTFDLLNL